MKMSFKDFCENRCISLTLKITLDELSRSESMEGNFIMISKVKWNLDFFFYFIPLDMCLLEWESFEEMKWGDVIERDWNLNDYVWRTISIRESQFKQGWGRDEPLNKCKNRTIHFF